MSDSISNRYKSGYQLRQELLELAVGIVSDRQNRLFENERLKPQGGRTEVPPYTAEDIVAEAERLYTFVQKK